MASRHPPADPPARNLSRNNDLVSSLVQQIANDNKNINHRTTTISDFYGESLAVGDPVVEECQKGISFGEDAASIRKELRRVASASRGGVAGRGGNLSEGVHKWHSSSQDDDTNGIVSIANDDDRNMVFVEQHSNIDERNFHAQILSEEMRIFLDFLTCKVLTACDPPSSVNDNHSSLLQHSTKTKVLQYEMPLQSVHYQVDEDIQAWGLRNSSRGHESTEPSKIAKAINFSSNRLDNKNAAIALYDEKKLRQEVHAVEIPEEIFFKEDASGAKQHDDEFAYLQRRGVPEAIVVKQEGMGVTSMLEDSSTESLAAVEEPRIKTINKAWSLSPRRKRRLKARARAVAPAAASQ